MKIRATLRLESTIGIVQREVEVDFDDYVNEENDEEQNEIQKLIVTIFEGLRQAAQRKIKAKRAIRTLRSLRCLL